MTALIPMIKQPIKMPYFGTHNIQKGVLNSILIELVSRQSSRTVQAGKKKRVFLKEQRWERRTVNC